MGGARLCRAGPGGTFAQTAERDGRQKFLASVVDVSPSAPSLWLEVLGICLRRREARRADGKFLAPAWLRSSARLRHDGDCRSDLCESPIQNESRLDR